MSRNHALEIVRDEWERGCNEKMAAIALVSQLGWPELRATSFANMSFRHFEEAEEQGIDWKMPHKRSGAVSSMVSLGALAVLVAEVVGIGMMIFV